jgi:long-chain acyl-CoA synthetase
MCLLALEKLETTYSGCSLAMKICLHADSDAKQPMAIIFPNEKNLRAASSSVGHGENEDLKTLCEDDSVKEIVLKELNGIGKKAGFKQMELLQCVVLDPEEWTPSNGLLTAAQKLQRKAIFEKHKEEIKKVYP